MNRVDAFRWLAVTFSMILGLGVTRVLSSAVVVFRSRAHAQLDWIPLAWAGAIFVLQLQFWWALIELAGAGRVWTLVEFLLVVSVPLLLFASGALVLPSEQLSPGDRLLDEFERDGRYGLVCLAGYAVAAFLTNFVLFDTRIVSLPNLYLAAEAALPIACVVCGKRRDRAIVTLAYLVLVLWSSWALSPKSY